MLIFVELYGPLTQPGDERGAGCRENDVLAKDDLGGSGKEYKQKNVNRENCQSSERENILEFVMVIKLCML